MKKSLIMLAIVAAFTGQTAFAQSTAQPEKQLLSSYYSLKNALIAGNGEQAASSAEAFLRTANGIDYKVVSEGNIHTLTKDATAISETKDVKKQREIFINLSSNMAQIATVVKLSDVPVYKQYCPMKKAYWLSSEKAIKNPYFGSSMLTCGNVAETIN